MSYYDEIKKIIQEHNYIPLCVTLDVMSRTRDWLELEYAGENDDYIKRQLNYLKEWIK